MAEKEEEKVKQSKKSSPCRSELGIKGFALARKPKNVTINIDQEPTDVKEGVESLFTIVGQALSEALPSVARLQEIAAEVKP